MISAVVANATFNAFDGYTEADNPDIALVGPLSVFTDPIIPVVDTDNYPKLPEGVQSGKDIVIHTSTPEREEMHALAVEKYSAIITRTLSTIKGDIIPMIKSLSERISDNISWSTDRKSGMFSLYTQPELLVQVLGIDQVQTWARNPVDKLTDASIKTYMDSEFLAKALPDSLINRYANDNTPSSGSNPASSFVYQSAQEYLNNPSAMDVLDRNYRELSNANLIEILTLVTIMANECSNAVTDGISIVTKDAPSVLVSKLKNIRNHTAKILVRELSRIKREAGEVGIILSKRGEVREVYGPHYAMFHEKESNAKEITLGAIHGKIPLTMDVTETDKYLSAYNAYKSLTEAELAISNRRVIRRGLRTLCTLELNRAAIENDEDDVNVDELAYSDQVARIVRSFSDRDLEDIEYCVTTIICDVGYPDVGAKTFILDMFKQESLMPEASTSLIAAHAIIGLLADYIVDNMKISKVGA